MIDINHFIKGIGTVVMNVEDIKQYCLEKHKTEETFPFGDVPIC